MKQIYEGQLRVVTRGEFTGMALKVGRVYPTLVELNDPQTGASFCSVTPAECEALTEPAEQNGTLVVPNVLQTPANTDRGPVGGSFTGLDDL